MQNDEARAPRDEELSACDRYRDLYRHAPVAYFTLTPQGRVLEVNLAGARMLGLPRERLLGQDFFRFLDPDQQALLSTATGDPVQGDTPAHLALTLETGDGRCIHTQAVISAATPVPGETELRLILTDISGYRLLEEQRDMFFSIASHELRTPLTNISLSLDMLLQEPACRLNEDLRGTLEVARRGTRRLHRLVDEILRLRDVRTGLSVGQLVVLDLPPLLRESILANQPFAAGHDVELELQLEPEVHSLQVLGNADRLFQVMNNLLTNAVKHSPDGGQVQIRLQRQNGLARVSVSDRGPGVPPQLRERIFQPFTQGNPSLEDERHKGSMGLGLSIGRAIVEQMGGRLDFISRPGVATTFYFEIPETSL